MLDDYVMADDGYYSWDLLDVYEYGDGDEPDVTVYMINMTSQKWMDGQQDIKFSAPQLSVVIIASYHNKLKMDTL